MCLVFVEADYLVAVTYNMFYDFDDVLSFSKFFVQEHFSAKQLDVITQHNEYKT